MSTLYTTRATAIGGRSGSVSTDDGLFSAQLALPASMGGNGNATNPEQLFAAGYAACFGNAVMHIARSQKLCPEPDYVPRCDRQESPHSRRRTYESVIP